MLKRLGFIVLVLVVLLVAGRNVLARLVITQAVRGMTGMTLTIEQLTVHPITSTIRFSNVVLQNPHDFHAPAMVRVPTLQVVYDAPALVRGTIHLRAVQLDLAEFIVVKNAAGQTNLSRLIPTQGPPRRRPPPIPMRASSLVIDTLDLQIGRVLYTDESSGPTPSTQTFVINLHERYQSIADPAVLGSLILVKALAKTTIARLTNLDLQSLTETASGALHGAVSLATGTVGTLTETGANALKRLKESVLQ